MAKKVVFYLIMLCFVVGLVEVFSFGFVQLVDRDDFFDTRDTVFARLNEADLAEFKSRGADPITGWNWWGPQVREEANCMGETIEYRYDAAGARTHHRFDAKETEVVVVGDSYTEGAEVDEKHSFPAKLSEMLGVSVANHGVGGYGPTQGLLNLQKNVSRYPQAKVVILVIMYENLYRMVNSYRPVLYMKSPAYSLKPYMAAGRIVPHPGSHVFDSIEQFQQAAQKSFDEDFWAKPVAEFPYSLALAKGLASNYFYYRKLQRVFIRLDQQEYFLIFNAEDVKLNLIALLNQYAAMAQEWGVQPIAIFVPRNLLDTTSASHFIAQHRPEIDSNLLIGDMGSFEGVDWVKFNYRDVENDNFCHPSPYGYQMVAEYIADFMRRNHVWPASYGNTPDPSSTRFISTRFISGVETVDGAQPLETRAHFRQ